MEKSAIKLYIKKLKGLKAYFVLHKFLWEINIFNLNVNVEIIKQIKSIKVEDLQLSVNMIVVQVKKSK